MQYSLHVIKRKSTSRTHKLPVLCREEKPYASLACDNDKENIPPNCYLNNYRKVSLNQKLITPINTAIGRKRMLNVITNDKTQEDSTQLILPDESNYRKIVNFVKDIKNTVTPKSNNLNTRNSLSTSRNEARHGYKLMNKFKRVPRTDAFRKRGLNNVSVVDPIQSLANHFIDKEDIMNQDIESNINEELRGNIVMEGKNELFLFPLIQY